MLLKKFAVKNYKNFKEEFVLDLGDVRDYKFNKDSIKNNVVKTHTFHLAVLMGALTN